ncbi:MAG: [protein-PII] uridylyltransferase [Parvibaculaceae bacterium]|jgi:[protein-PII] uridylyltransferase|nr:[protein-PII] uridylyltransferase [Parvibaculaceae bacterium]
MALRPATLKEIIDVEALAKALDQCAQTHAGNEIERRMELLEILKGYQTRGRDLARVRLEEGRFKGTDCAAAICYLQDKIICALYNFVIAHVHTADNPTEAEHLALVATGGYGRGLLAPGSDIDLLFLLPYKQTPWGENVVEYCLYLLWDLGLKVGHATRTEDECVRLAKEDMTIRTALLEARFLHGDKKLFENFEERFAKDVISGTGAEFVEAKLAERDERHERTGRSRYLVEPNVKDGKGGLRDLHTLYWIGKYVYEAKSAKELVKAGLFSKDELKQFNKAENFLWAIRCELHFITGRAEERITFDVQTEMANQLGYQSHHGMKGVERFMKHYFLIAKDVGDLTRIFCNTLEMQEQKKKPGIGRIMQAFSRKKKEIEGFAVEGGRLTVVSNDTFEKDPVNIMRLFHVADRHDILIHPDAFKLLTRSLKLVARLRKDKEANRIFLEILCSKQDPERILRRMNETGVLGRFIPDFGRIVALMQFNMYHHYTADEHLIRAIGIMSEIDTGKTVDEHPLAVELMSNISSRAVVFMSVLLHDIAKGRPEDHSEAGAKIASRLCPRLGMSKSETESVAWLVKNHLVMSDVAQRRDLSDPKTIQDFVRVVQSRERLKYLYLLTVVDIKAVGPGVFNGWKDQLLRQLYFEANTLLQGGNTTINRTQRANHAKAEFIDRIQDWDPKEREDYLARHMNAYWLGYDQDSFVRHAELIRNCDESEEGLVVSAVVNEAREATEITLFTQDHPGLFSRFAGACAAAGVEILEAKIFTTRDGMALDTLWVHDPDVGAIEEGRRTDRLEDMIRKVLAGEVLPPDLIESRTRRKPLLEAFNFEPHVYIDNAASDKYSVIEVNGLDRPGLLHALTRTLFHLGLTISSSLVTTYGERAVDVFYVADLMGAKITNAAKRRSIERQLLEALADPMKKSRPKKASTAKTPKTTKKRFSA